MSLGAPQGSEAGFEMGEDEPDVRRPKCRDHAEPECGEVGGSVQVEHRKPFLLSCSQTIDSVVMVGIEGRQPIAPPVGPSLSECQGRPTVGFRVSIFTAHQSRARWNGAAARSRQAWCDRSHQRASVHLPCDTGRRPRRPASPGRSGGSARSRYAGISRCAPGAGGPLP